MTKSKGTVETDSAFLFAAIALAGGSGGRFFPPGGRRAVDFRARHLARYKFFLLLDLLFAGGLKKTHQRMTRARQLEKKSSKGVREGVGIGKCQRDIRKAESFGTGAGCICSESEPARERWRDGQRPKQPCRSCAAL